MKKIILIAILSLLFNNLANAKLVDIVEDSQIKSLEIMQDAVYICKMNGFKTESECFTLLTSLVVECESHKDFKNIATPLFCATWVYATMHILIYKK